MLLIREKHWWIGLVWIVAAIATAAAISKNFPHAPSVAHELPIYILFFVGGFWTTLFAKDNATFLGISHIVSVTILLVAENNLAVLIGSYRDFSGWNGLQPLALLAFIEAVLTILPGVGAGLLVRRWLSK